MTMRYIYLDGLRGVAAILVVLLHVSEPLGVSLVPHGGLAVDFFFALSGFVIAHAYGVRMGAMSFKGFMLRRVIRLYPLILVGLIFGVLVTLLRIVAQHEYSQILDLVGVTAAGALLLPSNFMLGNNNAAWPLNPPSWSLLFEMLASAAFAVWLWRASRFAVMLVVAVTGFIAAVVYMQHGQVYGGTNWPYGIVRVAYPFAAGVLVQRIHVNFSLGNFAALMLALVVACALLMPVGADVRGLYETTCVLAVFPVLLLVSSRVDATGAIASASLILGELSYPLYAVHYPIMKLFVGVARSRRIADAAHAWLIIPAVTGIAIGISWGLLKLYDEPVRRYLTRRFT